MILGDAKPGQVVRADRNGEVITYVKAQGQMVEVEKGNNTVYRHRQLRVKPLPGSSDPRSGRTTRETIMPAVAEALKGKHVEVQADTIDQACWLLDKVSAVLSALNVSHERTSTATLSFAHIGEGRTVYIRAGNPRYELHVARWQNVADLKDVVVVRDHWRGLE